MTYIKGSSEDLWQHILSTSCSTSLNSGEQYDIKTNTREWSVSTSEAEPDTFVSGTNIIRHDPAILPGHAALEWIMDDATPMVLHTRGEWEAEMIYITLCCTSYIVHRERQSANEPRKVIAFEPRWL